MLKCESMKIALNPLKEKKVSNLLQAKVAEIKFSKKLTDEKTQKKYLDPDYKYLQPFNPVSGVEMCKAYLKWNMKFKKGEKLD